MAAQYIVFTLVEKQKDVVSHSLSLALRCLEIVLYYGVQLAGLVQDFLLVPDQRDAHVGQLLCG